MKFKAFSITLFIIFTVFLFASCKKSGDNSSSNKHSFTWTTGGKNFTPTIDTAFLRPSFTTTPYHIIAGFGTFPSRFDQRIDFHLSSFAAGSYTISSGSGAVNTLYYIDDAGYNLEAISGTLNITASSNNLISGNFSVVLINPSRATSTMTGKFTNVSVVP